MNDTNELTNWLTLYFLPSLGSKRLSQFYEHEQNPKSILANYQLFPLKAKSEYLLMKQNPNHAIWDQIQKNIDWINPDLNQHIIHINHDAYPSILKEIDDPPILLWIKGDVNLLKKPQVAVVGSRACTASGIKITQLICNDLARQNIQLISGGALGIDTIAHNQAIINQQPTLAILGTGVDGVYPKQNRQLFKNIENNGALVSEFALGTSPSRFNFPKRNRIISALSQGVLVIEAHLKSGSLITARLALEQNKEVMAVPGSPLCEASQGCNELISQGAHLIQNAQDILNILQWRNTYPTPTIEKSESPKLSSNESKLLRLISDVPQPIEILSHLSQLEFHQTQQQLFELELKGLISREMGGFIRC